MLASFVFSGLLASSNYCARATLFGQYHGFMVGNDYYDCTRLLSALSSFYSRATQFSEEYANLFDLAPTGALVVIQQLLRFSLSPLMQLMVIQFIQFV